MVQTVRQKGQPRTGWNLVTAFAICLIVIALLPLPFAVLDWTSRWRPDGLAVLIPL